MSIRDKRLAAKMSQQELPKSSLFIRQPSVIGSWAKIHLSPSIRSSLQKSSAAQWMKSWRISNERP